MEKYFSEMVNRYPALEKVAPTVKNLAVELGELFKRGNTLFLAGNGGSAADAEHICGELLKGFKSRRNFPQRIKPFLRRSQAVTDARSPEHCSTVCVAFHCFRIRP